MGCKTSKLDRLPAVALCRERCEFLHQALRQSYTLADAHVTHLHSLNTLPSALISFFQHFDDSAVDYNTISPINGNNAVKKTSPPPPRSPSTSSSSDARVLLHSELEAESDADGEIKLLTHQSSYGYLNHDTVSSDPLDDVAFLHYIQPLYSPFSPKNQYGGYNSPPPPPPPRSSAWDFLNFFEPYDRYQISYSPSDGAEATKKEKDKRKDVCDKPQIQNEAKNKGDRGRGKVNLSENKDGCSREKDLVSKKEAKAVAASEECSNSAEVKSGKSLCEKVKEIQIQILFERASDSANGILEMLDVGKLRYHKKYAFNPSYPGSCKMMNVFDPSIPSNSNPLAVKCREASLLGRRTEFGHHGYGNLCSTLKKLCLWEKKLYHEVKAEEKLRILHQKKCRELRRMSKKGADPQKIDSVRTLIGILSTKMKISIHVVDKISNTISKLRDEELWPQINRFILMFLGMWKGMLQCYKEIVDAKTLDAFAFSSNKLAKAQIDAAMKLKSEVQNWSLSFSDWIHAQKSYVKALNCWLLRCLSYEPEELPDDDAYATTPFSPGKMGAPPVFVICNKWSRAVDSLSERKVTEAVSGFMLRLNELLETHILETQENSTLDKELERKVKMLEKEEQKMHKIVQARERKMVPIRDDAVHHGDVVVDSVGLVSCVKQIFASMEKFTATAAGLYQELCQQINHVSG